MMIRVRPRPHLGFKLIPASEITSARTFKALQKQFGGGDKDGYFAVFKVGE